MKAMLGKLSQYPRLRVLIILVVLVVVFVVILNFMSGGKSQSAPALPPSHVQQGKAQSAGSVSPEQSKYYDHLNSSVNRQEYQQKVSRGQTVLTNVFDNDGSTGKSHRHLSETKQVAPPSSFKHFDKGNEGPLQRLSALNPINQANSVFGSPSQNKPPSIAEATNEGSRSGAPSVANGNPGPNLQETMQNLESTYQNAISQSTSSWNLPKMAQTQGAHTAPSHSASKSSVSTPRVVVKAGTIYFGVMDTALNSDQPGTPVLATVVSGPYNGAKLMGTFQREKDRLVIRFNTMSMPQWANTLAISAYAVDANTANNAVATSVNHHYLLRYGMLFASAFLEGFGNAYQSFTYACPPGTASCNIVNSNGLQNNQVTFTNAAYQGLGQIGTNLGQAAQQVYNTPPTVKVAQGTGIGVLFMSDITISQ